MVDQNRWLSFSYEKNGKIIKVPDEAATGTICPCRSDYFQCACWMCDFCMENERVQHELSSEEIKIGKFRFFKESIKHLRIESDKIAFEYGCKTIFIKSYTDIQYFGYSIEEMIQILHMLEKYPV